ncbi:MAG: DUF2341 domain-containing protein, partial [Chitinivibrionales bacterium]|nr:DUF2341 domain-containing protein [Chitinivibrionales bacterium]
MRSGFALSEFSRGLAAIVAVLLLSTAATHADNYDAWSHWMDIYLNTSATGADVADTLTDFPVLIRLDGQTFPFDEAHGEGADIRFANDSGDHLAYQIEDWDSAAGDALVWVEVDTVRGNDSTRIVMYWGNGNAADSSNGAAVFDTANAFEGVWHLDTSLEGATVNANNGTNYGTVDTTGHIGRGRYFDGADDHINCGNHASLGITGELTVSAWIRPANGEHAGWMRVVSKKTTWDNTYGYDLDARPDNEYVTLVASGSTISRAELSGDAIDANWHHIAVTVDGTDSRVYFDGQDLTTDSTISALQSSSQDLELGMIAGASYDYFYGIMDEVRVESRERTAGWLALSFENQKSSQTLVEFGDQQEKIGVTRTWDGGGSDSNWITAANWSDDSVPGVADTALFDGTSDKDCRLDASDSITSIQFTSGYNGTFDILSSTLTVSGDADFSSGGQFTGGYGTIRLTQAEDTLELDPPADDTLPAISKTGEALLRLTNDSLVCRSFSMSAGRIDFNGKNVRTLGDISITNGDSTTIIGLGGRSLTAGDDVLLQGQQGNPLDLHPGSAWYVSAGSSHGDLRAEFAVLGNSDASNGSEGKAVWTVDSSGNTNWVIYSRDDYAEWTYSKTLTLNTTSSGADVAGTVTDFPVLLRLNRANFNFDHAASDGSDIRFSKTDSSYLPYHIEQWDTTQDRADVWVLVDSVYGNDSTSVLMFWGKSDAPVVFDGAAVFDSAKGFLGAWHLGDSGTSSRVDITGNGYDGRPANYDGDETVPGVIVTCDSLEFMEHDTLGDVDIGAHSTVSAWVKLDSAKDWGRIITKEWSPDGAPYKTWGLTVDNSTPSKIEAQVTINSTKYGVVSDSAIAKGEWAYVAQTHDSSTLRVYVNGVLCGSVAASGTVDQNDYPAYLSWNENYSQQQFIGSIDEARVAWKTRSGDWLKLDYENQKPNQSLVEIPAYTENYAQWPASKRIYFNTSPTGADIDSAVENFRYLVRLSDANFNFYMASSDGADVRFSDPDGSHLHYEIDHWDPQANSAAIWVVVPRIDANTTTDYITMHYGRIGASDRQMPDSVWDSTYASVWHFGEAPVGDSTHILADASTDSNHATPQASMTAADRWEGVIGEAVDLDGDNDYLYTRRAYTNPDPFTVSAWIKTTTKSGGKIVGFEDEQTGAGNYNDRHFWMSDDGKLHYGVWSGAVYSLSSTAAYNDGEWHYLVGTLSGDGLRMYIDGVLIATDASVTSAHDFTGYWRMGTG